MLYCIYIWIVFIRKNVLKNKLKCWNTSFNKYSIGIDLYCIFPAIPLYRYYDAHYELCSGDFEIYLCNLIITFNALLLLGISCISKFSELSNIVKSSSDPIIIQKYIECPLLVYNTKFDIRQWFLVTDWNPLTVWWYKDSYIRFCSQEFTLNDFNE